MASRKIDSQRVQQLSADDLQANSAGEFVLYWMQQSQRAECNHALEFAIQRANDHGLPLCVLFVVVDDYLEANLRHYHFMLEGLSEVSRALEMRGIAFRLRLGNLPDEVINVSSKAAEIICDRGYLRHQRQWRKTVANEARCPVWQVESDVIVPVETASDKQEYAARTIRPKLQEKLHDFDTELRTTALETDFSSIRLRGESLEEKDKLLERLKLDRNVSVAAEFKAGTAAAKSRLRTFLSSKLGNFLDEPNICDPATSTLSPYLHFGQISPLQVLAETQSKRGYTTEAKVAFIEELLVRRELAINFTHYCAEYDSLQAIPDWASTTLAEHEDDEREYHYTANELEEAVTHDDAWNAMMTEMKCRGYLHNHLRMYWGKKIIEWTNTVQHAYRTALELNNKYFLDGRDPNSYANVGWLFGLHDRAHQEREIFGKVRFMNLQGLQRKFDVERYIQSVQENFA